MKTNEQLRTEFPVPPTIAELGAKVQRLVLSGTDAVEARQRVAASQGFKTWRDMVRSRHA